MYDLDSWRNRTFIQDILQTWQSTFIEFSTKVEQVKVEHMVNLAQNEHAENLYSEVRPYDLQESTRKQVRDSIKQMVKRGILVYGGQLFVCEFSSITSIYLLKLIIDHLSSEDREFGYGVLLFVLFTLFRLTADMARGYYDMHVYNYFRFVTTKV